MFLFSYRMTTITEKPKTNSTECSPIYKQKISLKQRLCEKLSSQQFRQKPWRALIAYWILGICNNYGYVVMLSAANDILHSQEESNGVWLSNYKNYFVFLICKFYRAQSVQSLIIRQMWEIQIDSVITYQQVQYCQLIFFLLLL